MKLIFTNFFIFFLSTVCFGQTFSSFEDFDIPVDSFWEGSDLSGDFVDGTLIFNNKYDTTYNFWSEGWAVSTMRDDSTAGFTNIYSAITAVAPRGEKYAIGQNNAILRANIDESVLFQGMFITNTTYAYLSMKNGDAFAKKFGGVDGKDSDFFKLRIFAMQNGKKDTTKFVDFYLADYRDTTGTNDYILDEWKYVDLSSLGYVDGLIFELSSSDIGEWGMNTPGFFAVDKIKYSFKPYSSIDYHIASMEIKDLPMDTFWDGSDLSGEFVDSDVIFNCSYDTIYNYWAGGFALSTMRDDSTSGYFNTYSSIAGGAYDGTTYAIGQNGAEFNNDKITQINGFWITNTTYAYMSMKNGDMFAKKFGGETGNDPDYFKLRIYAKEVGLPASIYREDTLPYVDIYLADFRFADNSKDYILDDWVYVNIDSLFGYIGVRKLTLELLSSDNGDYGMNTPGFFAFDRLQWSEFSGTDIIGSKFDADIYPNPTGNWLFIDSSEDLGDSIYHIIDLSGRVIQKGRCSNNNYIDVSKLSDGTYFMKILSGTKFILKKFVKI